MKKYLIFNLVWLVAYIAIVSTVATAQPSYAPQYATQAEAEAGAATGKIMNPLRTYQQQTARIASQAEAEAGTDNVKLMTPLKAKNAIQTYALRNSGEVLKETICADSAAVTLAGTVIPLDDTIPTSTEGDQIASCAFTQNINSGNILVTANISMAQGNTSITCAAFLDSDAAAFSVAGSASMGNAAVVGGMVYYFYGTGITSGAHTLKIRCASNSGAAIYVNSTTTGRKYGGVLKSITSVKEIK